MPGVIGRLITGWQQVVKRSIAHWRLLSSVVLGVLLSSAIMAGTVIYFDALRELALKSTLAKHTASELDILAVGQRGPVSRAEYERVSTVVNDEIDDRVSWLLRGRVRAGKTPTFFMTTPGNVDQAGDDNVRAYFAFLPELERHTTLLAGGPAREQRLNSADQPLELEALVPREAAELLEVGVGDRLIAVPPWDDVIPYVTVLISGVFERNDPSEEFWYLEERVLHAATGPSFRTVPFHLSETSFLEVLGPSFRKMDGTYAWLLMADTGRLNARNSNRALTNIEGLHSALGTSLMSYRQSTALDNALKEYDRRLFFSKLPMYVVLILIAVVILYYVVTLSSLVVEDRRSEVALLRSRGASSAQILTVFVLEGATIAVLAILAGPLLAASAITILGYTPAFSDLTGGGRLIASVSGGAYMMSALGGGLSFVALIFPAVQASRIGVTRHRQQAARPSSLPAFQRYYVDVLLLLLSIFLFRQLTEQGSVVATRLFGDVAVNQMLLALPGLMLVASAMVLLRLFPLAMTLGSRILSSWLPAGLVMGVWQMSRNPTHYARLSLLLILTAGLGIFASSFGATLERSFEERVLFATGSDIRLGGVQPIVRMRGRFRTFSNRTSTRTEIPSSRPGAVESYGQVPGVELVSPVVKNSGHDLTKAFGESYTMIGMDGESLSKVGWFRDDFSDEPLDGLLKSLKVTSPPEGIELPLDARRISVRLKADRPHPTVRVTARIKNAQGRYRTYSLGTLHSSDWTLLVAGLQFGTLQSLEFSRPLTLVSLRVDETGGGRRLQAGSIILDEIRVGMVNGETQVIERFDDATDWSVLKVTADAISDTLRDSDVDFNGDSGSVLFSWSDGSPLTARGIFHGGGGRSPLPVLASKSFVRATGHSRGEEFEVSVAGHRVPVRLNSAIDLFPTMTMPNQRYLVADLTSLTGYANLGAIVRELNPNELWLSTTTSGPERDALVQRLDDVDGFISGTIYNRAELLAESNVDPLVGAGWRALLFIAFSAVLILSCLGFLVHAYVSFRNRQLQFALLRTVGFSMRQLVTMLWLEQTLVIAAGMALGTWMGGRLGATIMPYLGHDDWGGRVLPPFAMQVNWGALLVTYAAMVLVFAVITLGLIWLVHRISLQRILRLGEM